MKRCLIRHNLNAPPKLVPGYRSTSLSSAS